MFKNRDFITILYYNINSMAEGCSMRRKRDNKDEKRKNRTEGATGTYFRSDNRI